MIGKLIGGGSYSVDDRLEWNPFFMDFGKAIDPRSDISGLDLEFFQIVI